MRCFLAIPLPTAQQQALAELQQALRTPKLPASWTKATSMHVTLRFLGDMPEPTAKTLQILGQESFQGGTRCLIKPTGLGCFPNQRRPAVLWVGLEVLVGNLLDLQQRAERLARAVGLPPERKPFRPHLTLARLRLRPWTPTYAAPLRQLQDTLTTHAAFTTPPFMARSIVLYKSTLRPEGALHEALMEFPLT